MSQIRLIVEPGKVMTWKEFQRKAPPRSIAIDGYVDHPTVFDEKRIIHNFDHHKGVNRLATRATCEQIRKAILQGMLDCFQDENGEIDITIYVNDCDEDICLSYFLLNNPESALKVSDPLLNKLIFFEDALDTTAGTFPFSKHSSFLREMEWIFLPYKKARVMGMLEKKNPTYYLEIIKAVERNILLYLAGKGDRVDHFNMTYEIIGGGKGWSMVREIGEQARKGMISDGIKQFVTVRERPDGKWSYVIGKMTPYCLGFNLIDWFDALNERENIKEGGWGGSDTIGGSPRGFGSSLSPEELQHLINEWMSANG